MSDRSRLSGVFCPVITPFDKNLQPDAGRLVRQCQWLLSQQAGLAVFGTNSEANSLSVNEKIMLLDRLIDAGIDPTRMMPGTGCCALSDTVALTAHAVKLGCAGTLMLPPFYYKGVSDDGLFASVAETIERVGDDALRIYLYHIPPVAQVGFSVELIDRLVTAYPDVIAGVKDSSGDWSNTDAMHERNWDDFRIFVGSESFLLANMQKGGAGCISATANVNPAKIHELFERCHELLRSPDGENDQPLSALQDLQANLDRIRALVMAYPMIPALKAVVAHFADDDNWRRVRPPLMSLAPADGEKLADALEETGFEMPGITLTGS